MANIVEYEVRGKVAIITLNRPEARNAVNGDVASSLEAAIDKLEADSNVWIGVLAANTAGQERPVFCAGADLQEFVAPGGIPGTEGMSHLGFVYKFQEYLADMVLAIHECDKPVIAAVNGAAVGGGLGLALACDIRLASETAKFGAVAIKTGLSAADVGTSYFLPRMVGAGIASELMLTGRIFKAEEARELRLVSRVLPPDGLQAAALEMARAVAENAEYGVWMTKKTLWSNVDAPSLRQAMSLENRTQVLGTFTGSMEAAMEAFAEGRKPRWKPL